MIPSQTFDPGIPIGAPIIDSGSSYHITGSRENLFELKNCEPHAVEIADGKLICGRQKGKLQLNHLQGTTLDNVVYAPGFAHTLISVKKLIDAGMKVEFTDTECLIYDKPVLRGVVNRGVYTLSIPPSIAVTALRPNSIDDWHQRLGHLNFRSIAQLAKSDAVKGLKITGPLTPSKKCEICAQSKITRAAAPSQASRPPTSRDEVCHGDLAGPFARSYNGNKYYYALKWMGHTSVYFLKTKDEAPKCFQKYMNIVNRRFKQTEGIKIYRSDNGGEFLGAEFRTVCEIEGITMEMSEPEVHHQNGVIERTHRTIKNTARTLMLQAKLPHTLWEYAVRSAVFSRNRVLSRADQEKTPFEKFWGRKPDLKMVKTFGQRCVVLIPPEKRSTRHDFRPKGRAGIFIGSDPQRKGYFVYVTGRGHRVVHSRSVVFLEPPRAQQPSEHLAAEDDPFRITTNDDSGEADASDQENELQHHVDTGHSTSDMASSSHIRNNDHVPLVRRSQRLANRVASVAFSAAHVALRKVINEPINIRQARASPEWTLWEKAIKEEIEALKANDTFDLVDPPPGAHIIGSTIVFRVKLSDNGEVDRLKARICAQGFTQEFLKDFFETYAPVARLNSIRVFFALMTQKGMRVRQGDVPTAYVKARLTEIIYVRQPSGFEEGSRSKVWRLKKALYGLKQAGREWNLEIDNFLKGYGLLSTRGDPCVYTHPTNDMIVLIYVDDILIGYQDEQDMSQLMEALYTKYGVKDLGEANWFLGIRVRMDATSGITTLDQSQFATEVTRRFSMDNSRPRKTPLDKGAILYRRTEADESADIKTYRQAVGALLYLARVTRPDISFAVNQVAAQASNPSKIHWVAVKNILRYVDATKAMGLVYRREIDAVPVRVYTDADWANNEEDRHSISGVLVQVFGCPVSWQTKRQRIVSKSSTIAEYIAADDGVEEAQWTQMLLHRLMKTTKAAPIPTMIDNQSTIKRLTNGKSSEAQKTVDCKFFSIRDAVVTGALQLVYCPTTEMLADGLTKSLGTTRFRELRKAVGVELLPSSADGEVLESQLGVAMSNDDYRL